MTDILENVVIPIVAIVAVFGSLFGSFYLWITRRHAERLALIERDLADALTPNAGGTLRAACGGIGLGLGVLAGWALAGLASAPGYVAYVAGPACGLGTGLLAYLRIVVAAPGEGA
jgi:hypothetical protein